MPFQDLGEIVDKTLRAAPADAVPAALREALRAPTPSALRELGALLIANGRNDLAVDFFRAMADREGSEPWARVGLARLADKRGDAVGAATHWRECLVQLGERIEPAWLVELARAEIKLGRMADAAASLAACVDRFPRFAPAVATQAELLGKTGRFDEAVGAWRAAFDRFAKSAQPWWFNSFAAAAQHSANIKGAAQIADNIARRLPLEPAAYALRATVAGADEDWSGSLAMWGRCLELGAGEAQPAWLNGRAAALFRLWRVDEAVQAWRDLVKRFPDFAGGYAALGRAAIELGWPEVALECFSTLIREFPDRAKPDWFAARANCYFALRRPAAAESEIIELETRFRRVRRRAELSRSNGQD